MVVLHCSKPLDKSEVPRNKAINQSMEGKKEREIRLGEKKEERSVVLQ
jgi:hypothetical protein